LFQAKLQKYLCEMTAFVSLLKKWEEGGSVGRSLAPHRLVIGGHESSGLFRSGATNVGVVLLQVKTNWNPKFLLEGKLFVSNTPARMQRVRSIPLGHVLPCVSKGCGKDEEWAWSGFWQLKSVVFKSEDEEAIAKEVGADRGKNKTGDNFDVGAVVTFAKMSGSQLPQIEGPRTLQKRPSTSSSARSSTSAKRSKQASSSSSSSTNRHSEDNDDPAQKLQQAREKIIELQRKWQRMREAQEKLEEHRKRTLQMELNVGNKIREYEESLRDAAAC